MGLNNLAEGGTGGLKGLTSIADVTLIDNFEDQDISEYELDTGAFSVVDGSNTQSGSAFEGSYVLEQDNDNTIPKTLTSHEGDGLNYYPQPDDTWAFYFQVNGNCRTGMGYFLDPNDTNDTGGDAYLAWAKETVFNLNRGGSTGTTMSSDSSWDASSYAGEWIKCEINHNSNGDYTAKLIRDSDGSTLASVSGNDDTHVGDGRGISWHTNSTDSNCVQWIDKAFKP